MTNMFWVWLIITTLLRLSSAHNTTRIDTVRLVAEHSLSVRQHNGSLPYGQRVIIAEASGAISDYDVSSTGVIVINNRTIDKRTANIIAVTGITVATMTCINYVHGYINSAADTCNIGADGGNTVKCVSDIFLAFFTALVGATTYVCGNRVLLQMQ
ncbi:hypothetical protein V1524DRAFT_442185 [Lipomyces starkeyi]